MPGTMLHGSSGEMAVFFRTSRLTEEKPSRKCHAHAVETWDSRVREIIPNNPRLAPASHSTGLGDGEGAL